MDGNAMIREVMREHGIDRGDIPSEPHITDVTEPNNIQGSKRYFNTKGFAHFNPHPGCNRTDAWGSAHSWSILDLKGQTFRHHFRQGCKRCNRNVLPHYDIDTVRRMAEWACKQYQIRTGIVDRPAPAVHDEADHDSKGPHDEMRCGMCKALGRSCWK